MATFKPEKYGKYLLLDRIARGGMAELYRGKIIGAQGFEKIVAIKKILPHLTDQEAFVRAFIDEARLAAFLQHPNIVQIYDFGEMADTYFISMEYLAGVDLKSVLKKSRGQAKPLKLALSLFYILPQICYGLQYAHNLKDFSGRPLNIIHRDLGPQNIFITYSGEIKLIDFGIAKASSHDATTYVGSLKGKLAYMSPEQAGGKEIDHRSDLFALGILLYELATGQRLYTGESQAILAKAGNADFTPPEQVKQGLPASLYTMINKALHKDPALRYQSAEQMRLDLEACAQELAVRVSRGQMAAYMHELFREEAAAEEKALKEAGLAVMPPPAPIRSPEPAPAAISGEDKTIVLGGAPVGSASRKKVVVVALLILALAAVLLDTPLTTPIRHKALGLFVAGQGRLAAVGSSLQDQWSGDGSGKGEAQESQIADDPYLEALLFFSQLQQGDPERSQDIDLEKLNRHAAYLEENYPQEALVRITALTERYPKLASLHFYMGKLHAARYETRQATAAYERALELDPEFTDAYFNLGYIYASAGNYREAEKMYARVVALAPAYLDEALVNLAVTQEKQNKIDAGIRSLQKALDVNPRNQLAAKKLEQWRR